MAVVVSINCSYANFSISENINPPKLFKNFNNSPLSFHTNHRRRCLSVRSSPESPHQDEEVESVGVKTALAMLRFYKREISPVLPRSCRYIPTCSEYSMEAYKKYGVLKGTVLTTWRLCRCNPLGGSGFDPPRWFGEKSEIKNLEEEEDNNGDEDQIEI